MKIIIIGAPAEGKTTVSLLIARALEGIALKVVNTDPDVPAFLNNVCRETRVRALASKGIEVTIETQQTPKVVDHRHAELVSLYSDMYKDRYNHRPRKDWNAFTVEQLQQMVDNLDKVPFSED